MLQINMADVMNVIGSLTPYLIAIGVIFVLALIITFAVNKKTVKEVATRKIIHSESWLVALVGIVVAVSMMLSGPLSTLLNNATATKYMLSDATVSKANDLAKEAAHHPIPYPQCRTRRGDALSAAPSPPCAGARVRSADRGNARRMHLPRQENRARSSSHTGVRRHRARARPIPLPPIQAVKSTYIRQRGCPPPDSMRLSRSWHPWYLPYAGCCWNSSLQRAKIIIKMRLRS